MVDPTWLRRKLRPATPFSSAAIALVRACGHHPTRAEPTCNDHRPRPCANSRPPGWGAAHNVVLKETVPSILCSSAAGRSIDADSGIRGRTVACWRFSPRFNLNQRTLSCLDLGRRIRGTCRLLLHRLVDCRAQLVVVILLHCGQGFRGCSGSSLQRPQEHAKTSSASAPGMCTVYLFSML